MHLWIDDERVEPKGWLRSSDCPNAIAAIELYGFELEAISFDYDIGVVGNGGDVAQYLLDNWKYLGLRSTTKFNVHSGNPVGTERTKKILEKLYMIWDRKDPITTTQPKEMWAKPPVDYSERKLPPFNKPRPHSIVRFKRGQHPPKDEAKYYSTILDKQFVFLGEFPNQPGHCILVEIGPRPDYPGRFEMFRHTVDFEEVPEDEL